MLPKRKRRSSEASQAAIFQAATHEFSERGFEAGGVDRIAAKARVNKAMLYYHFGSKRALYIEVLRDMFRAVSEKARGIADGPGTAPQKLERWITTIIQEAAARPWFPPIMLRELASGAPRFDPDTFALMNAVYGAVRDILLQGQREGSFQEIDPLLTHLTIMQPSPMSETDGPCWPSVLMIALDREYRHDYPGVTTQNRHIMSVIIER